MTIYIISDLHLGKKYRFLFDKDRDESKRTIDLFSPLVQVKDDVISFGKRGDSVIILGDFYDKVNVSPGIRQQTYAIMKEFVNKGINVHIIGGNHDTPRKIDGPSSLDDLRLMDGIFIYRDVTSKIIDGIGFVFIPFINPSYLMEYLGGNVSGTDLFAELQRRINEKYDEINALPKKVALVHYYIDGMKFNEFSNTKSFNEFIIPASTFDRFNLVLAGHIHKPQKVGKNIIVVGSGEKITFGERDEKKSYYTMEFTPPDKLSLKPHDLVTRKQVLVDVKYENASKLNADIASKISGLSGAIVKIVISCKTSEKQVIKDAIDTSLFKDCFYVYPVEYLDENDIRAKEMVKIDLTPKVLFEKYIDSLKSVVPAERDILKERGLEIIDKVLEK